MKLMLSLLLLLCAWMPGTAAAAQPAYAKWGQLAMTEVKSKYPDAKIIDYKHVRRKKISATVVEEKFKLWLRENREEFGVVVAIRFDKDTERVLSVRFLETGYVDGKLMPV